MLLIVVKDSDEENSMQKFVKALQKIFKGTNVCKSVLSTLIINNNNEVVVFSAI
mgnify:CR=1 FL=1